MQREKGFTLIELTIVSVLVGILAVVAIPRYIDQLTAARENSVRAVAAALAAGSANNYAIRSANASQGSVVDNCTDMASLLPSGLPTGYSIVSKAIANDATVTCTLNGLGGNTATFAGLGIS